MAATTTRRCPTCGAEVHGDKPCPLPRLPRLALLTDVDAPIGAPCRCLPRPDADWPACASCGLRQKPGKAFCGYCGSRWVTAEDG